MNIHKFSVSPANTFKACPRKFYYEYVLGYQPSVVPRHFILGDIYDKLLGEYDLHGETGVLAKAESMFRDSYDLVDFLYIFEKHYKPYAATISLPPITNGVQYGFGVAPFDDADWRITGYIDKVSFEEVKGELQHIITERKTTSDPIEKNSAYWQRLWLDPQIRLYVAALRREGFRAGWVNYEVIRKISKNVHKSFDRKLPLDKYKETLYNIDHGKTLVAHEMIFITKEMADEAFEEHCVLRNMIKDTSNVAKQLKDSGYDEKTAWVKHEKSCNDYGGCPFLGIDKGIEFFEDNVNLVKTHKRME